MEAEIIAELILIGGEDPVDPGHPDHDGAGGLLGDFATANSIDLENNSDPDNPVVMAYKGARHNFTLVVTDASYGTHNPRYVRRMLQDAKNLLGAGPPVPDELHFVGRQACSICHYDINVEYDSQAHGLDFLTAHGRDLVYGYGGGCAPCHSVGFDEPFGFNLDGSTPELESIGCEECHGMGSDHIYGPSPSNINRLPLAEDTCWDCHVTSYKVMDTNPDATNDTDLYEKIPGKVSVHHPQTLALAGTYGYNRDNEPGTHFSINNTCVTCHLTQNPSAIDHTDASLHIDFEACAGCHTSAGNAQAIFEAMEADIIADLIEIGGEDPAVPGSPDPDGAGGLLGDFAIANSIDLVNNADPDNANVKAYKGARHNYEFILSDKSKGAHNPGYIRRMIADAKELLGIVVPPHYVGSTACATCHSGKYSTFIESGHPYKLNKVENGIPPTYPFTTLPPNPPTGYTWDDVTYVIGGYGWKARFIDSQGYIVTGTDVQWNFQTSEWVAYHAADPPGTLPYDCGACHTTGWVASGAGGPHQDDLPGMYGTFAEQGVTCEACHGMGSEHILDPSPANIIKDSSSFLCGMCHIRGVPNRILVSGNLVKHHEQFNEMLASPHSDALTCNTCHDPHSSTKYDDIAAGTGVIAACTDCHAAASHQVSGAMGSLDCTDCHMPLGAKSAVSTGTGLHLKGDMRNHIWKIDTTGVEFADYFSTDGTDTWITPDINGKVTLNLAWACMQCHDGDSAFSIESYVLAVSRASGIHE